MMNTIWTNGIVDLYQGDCREVLQGLPAQSVHCVVTSPPYWGLRDYGVEPSIWYPDGLTNDCAHDFASYTYRRKSADTGKSEKQASNVGANWPDTPIHHAACTLCGAWTGGLGLELRPELYVEHLVEVFREVWRVLRDDGTLWLNLGDSYNGIGGPGKQDGGPIGPTAATAIEGTRGRRVSGLKPKDLVGIPWRVAFALQADGWYLRSDIIWQKPNPMPESVTDRPSKSHEYLFLLTKSQKYYYDADAIREDIKPETARNVERYGGTLHLQKGVDAFRNDAKSLDYFGNPDGRNKRSVWTIATHAFPEAHFATFPEKLVEPCILAGTSEKGVCHDCGAPSVRVIEKGELQEHPDRTNRNVRNVADFDGNDYAVRESTLGMIRESKTVDWKATCDHQTTIVPATVLDPFIGSGTTAVVAQRLNRRCIGIDASETYLKDIAIKRITGVSLPMHLD